MISRRTILISLAALVAVCLGHLEPAAAKDAQRTSITKTLFGTTPLGTRVDLYTLTNKNGLQAMITSFGAIVTTLRTPDRDGKFADVVLGLDGTTEGKGVTYHKYAGLCLEPEHFPNSPNMPHVPSVVLRPGQVYQHTVVFKFSTK